MCISSNQYGTSFLSFSLFGIGSLKAQQFKFEGIKVIFFINGILSIFIQHLNSDCQNITLYWHMGLCDTV